MQEKKFWQGTNFWIAIVLAGGGLFVGFPQDDARDLIGSLFALIGSAGALREKLKGLTPVSWKDWIRSPNTWNYLGAAIVSIVPAIPVDMFQRMRDLLDSAIGGNWQGIITALFSIGTMLYFIFKGPQSPPK